MPRRGPPRDRGVTARPVRVKRCGKGAPAPAATPAARQTPRGARPNRGAFEAVARPSSRVGSLEGGGDPAPRGMTVALARGTEFGLWTTSTTPVPAGTGWPDPAGADFERGDRVARRGDRVRRADPVALGGRRVAALKRRGKAYPARARVSDSVEGYLAGERRRAGRGSRRGDRRPTIGRDLSFARGGYGTARIASSCRSLPAASTKRPKLLVGHTARSHGALRRAPGAVRRPCAFIAPVVAGGRSPAVITPRR